MSNINTLLDVLKLNALTTMEASRPVNLMYGEVTCESPLEITVDQRLVLKREFLVLCRNVTDYTVNMEVNHQVEKMSGGTKDPSFQSHIHQYKGIKPFKVLNALKLGEKVLLASMQGGGVYIVIDRME